MIPQIQTLHTDLDWQTQLRDTIKSGRDLLDHLDLRPEDVGYSEEAATDFSLKVPMAFVHRMQRGDPRDPLLLQVLSRKLELLKKPGYGPDPVGETGQANPIPGIIQKYQGRALLVVASGCAINCRYCFRRHFPYGENQNSREDWHTALQHIRQDPEITEVILSGGDPLVAGDEQLAELVDQIIAIPQVKTLRIHTRLPVVIPDRVTDGLMDAICREGLQTVVVIHSNHAKEIDLSVEDALQRLRQQGVTLLNQSVLLASINDQATVLMELSQRLFHVGVLPYYLHLLDKVQGAAHFDISEQRARKLLGDISSRLPGYLVPRLVRETAGATSKISMEAIYRG